MKKLKIRGKELKRIGYSNDQVISLAINLAGKYFKRNEKPEVMELPEKILLKPENYPDDAAFGDLAKMLSGPPPKKKKKKAVSLSKHALEFQIYGEENIDPLAVEQMQMAMKLPVSAKGALMPDAPVGYGLPIGGVLATYIAVIPYAVGMDRQTYRWQRC